MADIIHDETLSGRVAGPDAQTGKARETKRMQEGQLQVITGFVIAVFGIVLYCVAAFSRGFGQEQPSVLVELGIVGFGTVIWLIGVIRYLNAAIDASACDEDML